MRRDWKGENAKRAAPHPRLRPGERDWWDTGPEAWAECGPGAPPLDVNLTTLDWCPRGGAFKWCGVGTQGEPCAGWILPHNAVSGHRVTFDFWIEKQKWVDARNVDSEGCIDKRDLRGFTSFAQADAWLQGVEAAIIASRSKLVGRACPVGWFSYWQRGRSGDGGSNARPAKDTHPKDAWRKERVAQDGDNTTPPPWYTERLWTPIRLCERGEAIGAHGCKDTCPGQYLQVRAAWPGLLGVFQSWIVSEWNASLPLREGCFPRSPDLQQPIRLYETDRTPERFLLEQLGCLSTSTWWRISPPYVLAQTTPVERACPLPGPEPGWVTWDRPPTLLSRQTAAIPQRGAICVPRRHFGFLLTASQITPTPPGTPGIPLLPPLSVMSYDGEMTSGRPGMPVPRWSEAARRAKPCTEAVDMGGTWSVWVVDFEGVLELWLAPQDAEGRPIPPTPDMRPAADAPSLMAVLPVEACERTMHNIERRHGGGGDAAMPPALLWADYRWFPTASVLCTTHMLGEEGSVWALLQPDARRSWKVARPVAGSWPPRAGRTHVAMDAPKPVWGGYGGGGGGGGATHGAAPTYTSTDDSDRNSAYLDDRNSTFPDDEEDQTPAPVAAPTIPATYGGLPTVLQAGLRQHPHDTDPVVVLSAVQRVMGGAGKGTRQGLRVCSLAWEHPQAAERIAERPPIREGSNNMHPTQLNTPEAETRLYADEPELLLAWFRLIWEWSPDVIIGYNIDGWDAPYIMERVLWWYEYLTATGTRPEMLELLGGAAASWGYWHEGVIGWNKAGIRYRSYHGPGARDKNRIAWGGVAHLDPVHAIRDNQSLKLRDYKLDSVAKAVLGERKIAVDVKRGGSIHRAGGDAFRGFVGYCEDDAVKPLLIAEAMGILEEAMTKVQVNRWTLTNIWYAGTMDVNKGNVTHYAHLRTYIVPVFAEDQVHASHFHAPGLLEAVPAQSVWETPPNKVAPEDVPPAPPPPPAAKDIIIEDIPFTEEEATINRARGEARKHAASAEEASWRSRADAMRADPLAQFPPLEKPHRPAPIVYGVDASSPDAPPQANLRPLHPTYANLEQNFTKKFGNTTPAANTTHATNARFPLRHFEAGHPQTQLSYQGYGSIGHVAAMKKKWDKCKSYGGGRVLEPLPGWLSKIYTLLEDFASLYPWVMRCHNACPTLLCDAFTRALYGIDTWRCNRHILGPAYGDGAVATGELEWEPCPVTGSWEGGSWIRVTYSLALDRNGNRVPMGLLGTAEVTLQAARDKAKAEMAAARKAGNAVLAANKSREEQAIKVVMNALYGMFGKWLKGRWPCTEVAAIIAARGRYALTHLEQVVASVVPTGGSATIMGDTDSNFVTVHPKLAPDIHGAKAFGAWLERAINLHMKHYLWDIVDGSGRIIMRYCGRHDVEHEGTMSDSIMMRKKKRYSAAQDGGPDVAQDARGFIRKQSRKGKGMEDVRRDSSQQTASMMGSILNEAIMSQRPRADIVRNVRKLVLDTLSETVAGRFLYSGVVMSKKLQETYANPDGQAHVRVVRAMEAAEPGSAPPVNARVPFVFKYVLPTYRMTKGGMRETPPSVAEKAAAPALVIADPEADLDMGAYAKATLKSISKVLEHIDPQYKRHIKEPLERTIAKYQAKREKQARPSGQIGDWLGSMWRKADQWKDEAEKDSAYYGAQAKSCLAQCRTCEQLTGASAAECANDSCPNLLDRAWSVRKLRGAHARLGTPIPGDMEDMFL